MKTNKFLLILMGMMFAFYACSDDSVSVIDVNDDDNGNDDQEEVELDPALMGAWVLDPTEGSLAVGPSAEDLSWWAISEADVEGRACLYDDLYIFNEDGTFENELGGETWLETWQGVEEDRCGEPVPPHDGSNVGQWSTSGSTVTIEGEGNYLGLSKVHNGGEDGNPANDRIEYTYELSEGDEVLEIRISGWNPDVANATWYYRFIRQ